MYIMYITGASEYGEQRRGGGNRPKSLMNIVIVVYGDCYLIDLIVFLITHIIIDKIAVLEFMYLI